MRTGTKYRFRAGGVLCARLPTVTCARLIEAAEGSQGNRNTTVNVAVRAGVEGRFRSAPHPEWTPDSGDRVIYGLSCAARNVIVLVLKSAGWR